MIVTDTHVLTGLMRVRDNLKAQLRELAKQKPRGQTDENLIAEISRLESTSTVTRDDLVRDFFSLLHHILILSECLQTPHNRFER